QRAKAVDAEIAKTMAKAEDKIRKSLDKAMAEIDTVAVEATRELVAKLTGRTVTAQDATRAVKAVSNG
ncbi:MAG: ATPase, partial [Alphaproteobacteria bacterium]